MIGYVQRLLVPVGFLVLGALVSANYFLQGHAENGGLAVIVALVFAGLGVFLVFFVQPWRVSRRTIDGAVKALTAMADEAGGEGRRVVDLDQVRRVLGEPLLEHPWREFEDTLHAQASVDEEEDGTPHVDRYRQTVPAEMYFSYTALVEVPLRTEFFKHLPGILTGLAIIGTFLGLISGLGQFDVIKATSQDSNVTDVLIDSVYKAFFVSLLAIAVAMGITAVEKSMVNAQIARVTRLCEAIDHLFEAGAGEEYLSRLVRASEEGAAQTTQLKDALVLEISQVLERLTQMQIEALRESSEAQVKATRESASEIASEVSRKIKDTFEEPLRQVAESIDATNQSTDARVGALLDDLLGRFSQRAETMFGDQIGELTSLLGATSTSMQSAISQFEQLGENIESAGRRAASAMTAELQTQMAQVVEQLLDGQQQLNSATQNSLDELKTQLAENRQATASVTREMQTAMASLTASTEAMMEQFEASTRRLDTAVTQIYQSATELAANLRRASAIASSLNESTSASDESLRAIQPAVDAMAAGARQLTEAVATAETVLESTQREAAAMTELIQGVEESSAALAGARNDTTTFLRDLQESLVHAHEAFSRQVERSLDTTTKVFHQDLDVATRQLSGIVKELGEVLDDALDSRAAA